MRRGKEGHRSALIPRVTAESSARWQLDIGLVVRPRTVRAARLSCNADAWPSEMTSEAKVEKQTHGKRA